MDFLDPKKKRAHKIRLYIGYALMGIALTIISVILIYEARGFDRDWKTGEIIQNGLVFADTHPESAEIYVNGKLEGNTDLRLTIPAGQYNFEFKRDGYRSWNRSFNLGGGEIERLNYAFLFPNELKPEAVRSYDSTPAFATQSPDRKWVLIQQLGSLATFDLLDISNQENPVTTSFSVPQNVISASGSSHKLELVEWSNDNRRFLVKHTFTGGSEFLLIDREKPAESVNLNNHFSTPIHTAALRDKKYDRFHILDGAGGTLRLAELQSKKTNVVASKVFNFKSYGEDVMLYVTSEGAKKNTVIAAVKKGDKTYSLRSMQPSASYPLDITRYDNEWLAAVSSPAEKKAYIYGEFFKDLEATPAKKPFPLTIFRMKRIDEISVSANTRFIAVQGGSEFAVHDAEHNRQYQYDTKLNLANQKVKWMDGHRFAAVVDGKLTVWEYDGINTQQLVDASAGFIPFFDRDYDFLYTISPASGNKSSLNKTSMRTEADL